MANNALVNIIKSGDRDALNSYLAQQTIGSDQSGMSLDGVPNNALTALVRGNQMQSMRQPVMQDVEQPMNTIRTSSGQYLTPMGDRSNAPVGFASNNQPQFQGTPVDVMGQGKGYLQPDGSIIGVNAAGQRFSVNPAGTAAAQQAQADAALKRQQAQANLADTIAQTQQRGIDFATKQAALQGDMGTGINKNTPEYKSGVKQLEKDDSQVAQAQALTNAYKRWQELQPQVTTGPIAGNRMFSFDPNYQEMKQLENYLTMNNFKAGQGSISNTERAFMKGSGPNTMYSPETNLDIVKVGLGAAQNMQDRANFREQWLMNKGNLYGSDAAWQKYLDNNPRYIKDDKTNRMIENTSRQDWTDYIQNPNATKPKNVPSAHPQDAEAIAWARANPNNPQAARILQINGVQ